MWTGITRAYVYFFLKLLYSLGGQERPQLPARGDPDVRRGERDVPAVGGGGRELARAGRHAGAAVTPRRRHRTRGAAPESATRRGQA